MAESRPVRTRMTLVVVVAFVVATVASAGCSSGSFRFDDDAVVPLGTYCPQAKSSVADLISGIQTDKAGAFLAQLTADSQLQASIAVLVAAKGDATMLKAQDARDAANDIRQWLNLACPPLGSAPLAPPPSS